MSASKQTLAKMSGSSPTTIWALWKFFKANKRLLRAERVGTGFAYTSAATLSEADCTMADSARGLPFAADPKVDVRDRIGRVYVNGAKTTFSPPNRLVRSLERT